MRIRLQRRELWIALFAAIASVSLMYAASASAAGGCSIASAPAIASAATQTSDPSACSGGPQYWVMNNLQIGDTLKLDGVPSSGQSLSLDIYGPNVQTIGQPLCSSDDNALPFSLSCLIPAAGSYVLVTQGAGSFTPTIRSVPPHAGRAAGSCDSSTAPNAPADVTQYTNTQVCQPSGDLQYWVISLQIGDTLKLNGVPSSGQSLSLDIYGPNVQTIGQPLCSSDDNALPFSLSCSIRRAGRYLLVTRGVGPYTPLAIHRTSTRVSAGVKRGGLIVLRARIFSNAPHPTGTCVVQKQSHRRWMAVARKRTTTGVCRARLRHTRAGALALRVRFAGARGWASSTSRRITVIVS